MFGGSRLRCDSCGMVTPDAVAPILHGIEGWGEFELDGVIDGKPWVGPVLLCGIRSRDRHTARDTSCHARMKRYIDGAAASGPAPRTFNGGRDEQPRWPDGPPPQFAPSEPADQRKGQSHA